MIATLMRGGAAIAALNVYHALSEAGHEISFCAFDTNGLANVIELDAGNQTAAPDLIFNYLFQYWHRISSSEKINEGASDLFSDSAVGLMGLSRQAAQAIEQAEAVNLHWTVGIYASQELLAALSGKRVVLTLHDMNAFTGGCHYHISCRKFKAQCHTCPCLKNPSPSDYSHNAWSLKKHIYEQLKPSVITPSRWLTSLSQQSALLGSAPAQTIIHCQLPSLFKPLPADKRAALRKEYGIDKDDLVIMAGAHIADNKRKNISALLEALDLLCKDGLKFKLYLFGEGYFPSPTFPIRQLGPVERERLATYYNLADLFIHPSKMDALTLTLCEAQCCGTPVMSFDAGGTVDTFIPEVTGFLVEPLTPKAMAEKLKTVLKNKEALLAMRPAVSNFAETKFAPPQLAKAYEEVFKATPPAQPDWMACLEELHRNTQNSLHIINSFAQLTPDLKKPYPARHGIYARLYNFLRQVPFLKEIKRVVWRKILGKV